MRVPTILDSRLLLPCTLCVLMWSAGASAQPCSPAQSGNSSQSVAQTAQQLVTAVNSLKSVFGGNKPQTANTSAPCAPSASARPVSATASSAAPAAQPAPAVPADANEPIPATAVYSSSLIPPAPASGIDPSRLPDLVGIHIAEPTDEVVAQIRKLYPPKRPSDLSIRTQGYAYVNDPFYTSSIAAGKPNLDGCTPTDCQAQDIINALFSGPPDQRVVELVRSLGWAIEKQPTMATVRAALIQKYGSTFEESNGGGLMMTWLFDEEGNPMPPLSKAAAINCGGGLMAFGGGTAVRLPDYLYRGPPPQVVTQLDLDRFTKPACGRKIWVQAQMFGQSGGTVNSMQVTLRDYAADLRDAFAAENVIRQAKYAQGNQQLKNAQQQTAPTF